MQVTAASSPIDMRTALTPATPPPITTTFAGATPAVPPSSMPRPPCSISRQCAPAWIDMRPATSLIGDSSGSPPRAPVTVSYAIAVTPERINALACAGSGARWR